MYPFENLTSPEQCIKLLNWTKSKSHSLIMHKKSFQEKIDKVIATENVVVEELNHLIERIKILEQLTENLSEGLQKEKFKSQIKKMQNSFLMLSIRESKIAHKKTVLDLQIQHLTKEILELTTFQEGIEARKKILKKQLAKHDKETQP